MISKHLKRMLASLKLDSATREKIEQEFDRDLLVHALRTSVVRLEFTKKSGEYRVMRATLKEDMIPSEHQPSGEGVLKTAEVRPVYDLDNMGWRSFRWDSLKSWADWEKFDV